MANDTEQRQQTDCGGDQPHTIDASFAVDRSDMSMGIGLIELVVLAAIVAGIVVFVRKSSWKTLIAVPLGILLLVSAATMVWALAARSVVHTEVWSQPTNWSPNANWVTVNAPSVSQSTPWNGGVSRVTLFFELLVIFIVPIFAAIIYFSRNWIARNAGIVIPIAVVGGLGLLVLLPLGLYLPMRMQVTEEARRAEMQTRLREIGVAMHNSSQADAIPDSNLTYHADPPVPLEPPQAPHIDELVVTDTVQDSAVPGEGGEAAEAAPAAETPVTPELPDWAQIDPDQPADLSTGSAVLRSDEWSTVEESEQQLTSMTQVLVTRRFEQDHPELAGWRASPDVILQSGAITQRHVAQSTLQVGEFESPMYRSYWKIEYNSVLSDRIYAGTRQQAVQARVSELGVGAAALTALFGLVAAALRIDASTGGRHRRRMAAAAVSVVAAAAGAAAFFIA